MRCLNCRYSLKGLSEHRCPECGREFDPSDPNTFRWFKPRPVWQIILFSLPLGWAAAVIGIFLWAWIETPPGGMLSGWRASLGIALVLATFEYYWTLGAACVICVLWLIIEFRRRRTKGKVAV